MSGRKTESKSSFGSGSSFDDGFLDAWDLEKSVSGNFESTSGHGKKGSWLNINLNYSLQMRMKSCPLVWETY